MHPAWNRAARTPGDEERHPLVIVQVRVAHRRAVDDRRAVEQRAVVVRRVFQLLEKLRKPPDVVGVDLREVEDAILAAAVVRRVVERAAEPALGVGAVGVVAPELEREHPRDIRLEREHLEIEHQPHVLGK
jgi:hypothetical protein